MGITTSVLTSRPMAKVPLTNYPFTDYSKIHCSDRSGWVSHLWFGFGTFSLKIPNLSISNLYGSKMIYSGQVKKYPGQRQASLLFAWVRAQLRNRPWPDPTRAYLWPAVNKRPTRLRPGYFPNRPEDIFFYPKGKNLKNLTFLGEISQIQTQNINDWPDPSHKKLTRIPITSPTLIHCEYSYVGSTLFINIPKWENPLIVWKFKPCIDWKKARKLSLMKKVEWFESKIALLKTWWNICLDCTNQ